MAKIEICFTGQVGVPCSGTIERLADNFFRQAYTENFVNNPVFAGKAFPLIEGVSGNGGNYRQTLVGDTWLDGLYIARVHSAIVNYQVIGSEIFAVRSGTQVPIGYEGQALDVYHADIQFNRNNVTAVDEYTVTWFKNGVIITDGSISAVTIEVLDRAAGHLIPAGTTMIQVGITGNYKYDAISIQKQILGNTYIVICSAVINGITRSYSWNLGRDA
jgi:hypothetical protein